MDDTYRVGQHFQSFIKRLLATGRYGDASEIMREALGLLEQREHRLAMLDQSVALGLADLAEGRVQDAAEVLDEFESRYARMAEERGAA